MIREQVGGAAWDSWPVGAQVAVVTLEDTLAAQTRLLELAETLAGAVKPILCNGEINNVPGMQDTCLCGCDVLHDAFDAFVAAQAEHQTTGTVPCPECEATKLPCDPETKGDGCPTLAAAQGEIRRLEALLDGPARSDEEPTYPNEFADEALYRRHVALMAERDDLRRQLTQENLRAESALSILGIREDRLLNAETENAELRRQLAEAQERNNELHLELQCRLMNLRTAGHETSKILADNAALVEALSKYGEHTGGDSETGNSDETSCGCGLWNIRAQPHPGAGLLAELAALRRAQK